MPCSTTSASAVAGRWRVASGNRAPLDRFASGAILVAKTDKAHQELARQFENREVHKTYLALVHGRLTTESRSSAGGRSKRTGEAGCDWSQRSVETRATACAWRCSSRASLR
ncbi:MAG: pseudouridine synthase [Bryobacterales bacterium]